MRASMMRPTRPLRRNPYNATVANALQNWFASNGLIALAMGGEPAAAPAPAAPVAAPTLDVKSLPHSNSAHMSYDKGTLLLVTAMPSGEKSAWFHFKPNDWSKVHLPEEVHLPSGTQWSVGGTYANEELTESAMQVFVDNTVANGGTVQNLGPVSWEAVAISNKIVAALGAAPAAPGAWGTVLPKNTVWKNKPSKSVLVLFDANGTKKAWFHYAEEDWTPILHGLSQYGDAVNESEFASKAAAAAAVVQLPGAYVWGDFADVMDALGNVPPLAALGTPTAAPAAPAPALSPEVTEALKGLHAYIKGDTDKVGMTGAILKRIDKNADDYFASGYGSDFDGYGSAMGRAKFLTKLTDLGLTFLYGKLKSGSKAVKATPLGVEVAKAWVQQGYSDPALLGAKAKKPKAAAPASVAAAVAEITAPVPAGPKSKQITSIADSLGTLGPLIVEAASKVTGITTEAGAGGVNMMTNDLVSSVSISAATANTVTLAYYRDSFFKADKTVTLAVPDAAGMLASSIAQAMVYFLVYSHESGGKVAAQPPPGLPDPQVVGGVPLVTGAEIVTQGQMDALPPGSVVINGQVRYFAYPNWDTYFKPVANPQAAAQQGIVFPAPKQPGWPAVQVAPTLAVYEELPVGTLLRTDFSGGSVYATRVDGSGYQKVDSGTGAVNTGSSKRSPSTLVSDAAKNNATPYIIFFGKGKIEDGTTYKEWIEGKRIDNAEIKAQQASALVEMLAEALGIDPRVAALFTTKALQAMIAQTGIPYMGSTLVPPIPATAQSPLLKKNPAILGGFRSNPERYRDVVRAVLRNPRPTLRDLQDAELLEAAGLPLHDALPRRRNPDGGLAAATDAESGIIKAVADALKAALGSGAKPSGSTNVGSSMDYKLSGMYGSGGTPRPETSGSLAQWLRYLVAARAAGLWKNYIDPGERSVVRGLSFTATQANDPSQSLRVNADGLSQIEVMKAAGTIGSGPISPYDAMKAWLKKQATGSGWFREDVGQPWKASSSLMPPSSYPGQLTSLGSYSDTSSVRGWNTKQRIEGGNGWNGKMPYPSWAAEPWANVEGFCVDYHDPTYSKFTATEWGATLWGYGTQKTFCMRANTRDPRFVLLPGSTISGGPLATFQSEGAIVFVTIDEKPLKAEVILVGSGDARLDESQLWAWIRARPAYPTGPKPVGPAQGIVIHRNPAPMPTRLTMREVHAFLFPRAKWGPGAVRNWLAQRGLEGLNVGAAGGNWRVDVYASSGFRPGTLRQRAVGDGVIAVVGHPL